MPTPLAALETPALLLDATRMDANIAAMSARARALGVALRPHVKTAKSAAVALRMCGGAPGPITVSTLREADEFAAQGYTDICYAVGITPNKLAHVARLLAQGVRLSVILDSLAAAQALAAAAPALPATLAVLIEIDTDGHRAGLRPDDGPGLRAIAAMLASGGPRLCLAGVLTHHGASYEARGEAALAAAAETERAGAVAAAQLLRAAGHAAPVVSVGSTPTALFARQLSGVTELRAGVYVFHDLVMAGLGVCRIDDIASSVLTAVVGQRADRGWTLVDAGWMALSRDRGTAGQAQDQGYGLVCDAAGRVLPDWIVVAANQEHGIIAHRSGDASRLLDAPVGTLLRILPNHACATCAQHAAYQVIDASNQVIDQWPRFGGW
ncbi:MAG: alanine racemase [Burkholderiaceae bacterium]|nr:alanine racemase [Burkholderiaceae bacterium]